MKSRMEFRLECLKMAASLAGSKNITPSAVIPTAMEFYKWVENNPDEDVGTERLSENFKVTYRGR